MTQRLLTVATMLLMFYAGFRSATEIEQYIAANEMKNATTIFMKTYERMERERLRCGCFTLDEVLVALNHPSRRIARR